jgi:hypothetical protein
MRTITLTSGQRLSLRRTIEFIIHHISYCNDTRVYYLDTQKLSQDNAMLTLNELEMANLGYLLSVLAG